MSQRSKLLVIDPQNDFCDFPADYWGEDSSYTPALAVPGAHADMLRLASFIRAAGGLVQDIAITLDSHHHVGIERPTFWKGGDGSPVGPFTQITAADVRAGKYLPRDADATDRVLDYLDKLEAQRRYTLMVWPIHCEIGTWGHNVHPDVRAAYNVWERESLRTVKKVIKGTSPWTEHYSAVRAEVPLDDEDHTQTNKDLLAWVDSADVVFIAGEAGSHCVKSTVEHLVEHVPRELASKLVLLTDCISPVAGFEGPYDAFLADMADQGLATLTTAQALQGLKKANGLE